MVLFVKRTFAVLVSSTSRVAQSGGGGWGRWKRMCPSEAPEKAGPVWFSEGPAVCEQLRDTHQRPFKSSPAVNPESLSSLNWGQLQSWSSLPGQWVCRLSLPGVGSTVRGSDLAFRAIPFHENPSSGGPSPECQSKQDEVSLLSVQFGPFRRQLACL